MCIIRCITRVLIVSSLPSFFTFYDTQIKPGALSAANKSIESPKIIRIKENNMILANATEPTLSTDFWTTGSGAHECNVHRAHRDASSEFPVTEAAAESLQLKEPGPLESEHAAVLSAPCWKNMDSEAFCNSPVVLLARQKNFQSLGLCLLVWIGVTQLRHIGLHCGVHPLCPMLPPLSRIIDRQGDVNQNVICHTHKVLRYGLESQNWLFLKSF